MNEVLGDDFIQTIQHFFVHAVLALPSTTFETLKTLPFASLLVEQDISNISVQLRSHSQKFFLG